MNLESIKKRSKAGQDYLILSEHDWLIKEVERLRKIVDGHKCICQKCGIRQDGDRGKADF